jgi:uncharacterized protein involved in exopolysaccharide biosynthesis
MLLIIETSNAPVVANESRDFWGWIELLWDERRKLILWSLVGFALACLLAVLLPRKYQATTRVLPSETGSSISLMAAGTGVGAPNLGSMADLLGARTSGALCAAILRSDTVLDAIINRFDLREAYYLRDYDTARAKLADHTVISEDKKSGIVVVTVTDREPRRAAAMANAYAEEADKQLRLLNTSSAHREREFLEQRIAIVRDNLIAAEKQLAKFSSKNSALDIKEQGKAAFEVTGKIQGELIASQSELQGLREIYGPEHPRVKSLEAKVVSLKASIAKVGAGPGGGEGLDYFALSKLPALGATYADIFREVKLQEGVYEALVKQHEISKLEEVKATPRLKVVDIGKVPERKSSPQLSILFLICTVCGFIAGAVAIMVSATWRDSSPETPRKQLGVRIAAELWRPNLRRALRPASAQQS